MSEFTSQHTPSRSPRYIAQTVWTSPLGALRLARTGCGLAGAWFVDQKDDPGLLPGVPDAPEDPLLADTIQQLEAYWRGQRQRFDLPLDLIGTPFQRRVWQALLHIPFGQCGHYGDIARHLGQPQASRAVGGAIGRNPISVIVPCHRVIGQNGTLTGYSGGMPRKVALLQLEGHMLTTDRLL